MQYATRVSPFICCMPRLSHQLCFQSLQCGEALSHYTRHLFSTLCPQQGLPCVVSNKSFLSVELGWAYQTSLRKWLRHLIWTVFSTWQTWFELTGKFVFHCSLNTVCPVSPVLSIVERMGPVFVGRPNDKPRCPQARRGVNAKCSS